MNLPHNLGKKKNGVLLNDHIINQTDALQSIKPMNLWTVCAYIILIMMTDVKHKMRS